MNLLREPLNRGSTIEQIEELSRKEWQAGDKTLVKCAMYLAEVHQEFPKTFESIKAEAMLAVPYNQEFPENFNELCSKARERVFENSLQQIPLELYDPIYDPGPRAVEIGMDYWVKEFHTKRILEASHYLAKWLETFNAYCPYKSSISLELIALFTNRLCQGYLDGKLNPILPDNLKINTIQNLDQLTYFHRDIKMAWPIIEALKSRPKAENMLVVTGMIHCPGISSHLQKCGEFVPTFTDDSIMEPPWELVPQTSL